MLNTRVTKKIKCDFAAWRHDLEDGAPEYRHVCEASMNIVGYSANTSRQIREKLTRRGFSSDEAEYAIDLLKKHGIVDDEALFDNYVHLLAQKKLYGRSRIRLEVLKRFCREDVEAFFDKYTEDIDFYAYCLQRCGVECRKYKTRALLCRRLSDAGYTASEISRAVSRLWQSDDAGAYVSGKREASSDDD